MGSDRSRHAAGQCAGNGISGPAFCCGAMRKQPVSSMPIAGFEIEDNHAPAGHCRCCRVCRGRHHRRRCRAARAARRPGSPRPVPATTYVMHRDEQGRTRTKILVQKRSYLDGGTEVMPGDIADHYSRTSSTIAQPSTRLVPNDIVVPVRPDPRSVLPARQEQSLTGSRLTRSRLGRELFHLGDDRVAHLRRADELAAVRLDVGGAQPLGERRGDRLVDQVGLACPC